jgi:hypothetical protein
MAVFLASASCDVKGLQAPVDVSRLGEVGFHHTFTTVCL